MFARNTLAALVLVLSASNTIALTGPKVDEALQTFLDKWTLLDDTKVIEAHAGWRGAAAATPGLAKAAGLKAIGGKFTVKGHDALGYVAVGKAAVKVGNQTVWTRGMVGNLYVPRLDADFPETHEAAVALLRETLGDRVRIDGIERKDAARWVVQGSGQVESEFGSGKVARRLVIRKVLLGENRGKTTIHAGAANGLLVTYLPK